VRRLLAIAFRDRIREIERAAAKEIALAPVAAEIVAAAIDRAFLAESLPLAAADFARRVDEGRSRFPLIAQEFMRLARALLADRALLEKRLAGIAKSFPQAADDMREQLARLLHPKFLSQTPWPRLQHLPRYLKAVGMRLDKLREDPARDARLSAEMAPLLAAWRREVSLRAKAGPPTAELEQFGWLLEELRVSLFAQSLKTPVPVSVKRLAKLWHSIRR
jgi:ATP-dependent helicase HrpA